MKQKAFIFSALIIMYACISPFVSLAQPGQVQANGITIAYESFGAKENQTVLLISGTNAQLTLWSVPFCKALVQRGYRVIRFDNRDIGLSQKFTSAGMPDWAAISAALQSKQTPPLAYTLDDMADDAVALLDALGIKKAHIVGISMGGMIAQRVAYNHPEHTLSLASISSGGGNAIFPLVAKPDVVGKLPQPGDPNDTAAYIQREVLVRNALAGSVYQPNQQQLLEEIKTDVARSYYPAGLARQGAASTVAFYAGRQAQLKTIKVATIVIHGTEDPLVTPDAGKDVADNIPGATFELIKGMGHDIPVPLTEMLVKLIADNAAKAK